jgi:DNA-binding NarL/FixJ family response regulator
LPAGTPRDSFTKNYPMIKIAIAEDNVFLLAAVKEKLSFYDDLRFKFHGINGEDLLQKLEQDHNIDVILMDIQMPGMNGIDTTALVKSRHPQIKIIMLTVFDDDENVFNAIRAGADGYLLKETDPGSLHRGIVEIMSGGASMSPSIAMKTLKLLRNPVTPAPVARPGDVNLSARETGILEQLSKGLNYQQIADNLNIAPPTVRKHIENIYKKLQVHNKMEAVQKASKYGLL